MFYYELLRPGEMTELRVVINYLVRVDVWPRSIAAVITGSVARLLIDWTWSVVRTLKQCGDWRRVSHSSTAACVIS